MIDDVAAFIGIFLHGFCFRLLFLGAVVSSFERLILVTSLPAQPNERGPICHLMLWYSKSGHSVPLLRIMYPFLGCWRISGYDFSSMFFCTHTNSEEKITGMNYYLTQCQIEQLQQTPLITHGVLSIRLERGRYSYSEPVGLPQRSKASHYLF